MRLTLLRMTQLILSGMDSDEVNDIDDTVESRQVVDAIETSYYDIAATIEFPDHWDFFELEPSLDVTRPTLMYLPDRVTRVEWIKYNYADAADTDRDWRSIIPMERERFFDRMNGLDTADSDVYQFEFLVDAETFDVRGKNNKNPSYYTTMDNRTLLFDSYNSDEDTTLQQTKTHCYGMIIPEFTRDNDFTPDLEPRQFTLLFNEAKAQCFSDLKQVENTRAERKARRGWVHSQKKKDTTKASPIRDNYPNYGRRR